MDAPSEPLPGALVAALADRYRIERQLGAGGMATVVLAHDLKHDRSVALKVLKPELAAVIGGARFLSEIKTTAKTTPCASPPKWPTPCTTRTDTA